MKLLQRLTQQREQPRPPTAGRLWLERVGRTFAPTGTKPSWLGTQSRFYVAIAVTVVSLTSAVGLKFYNAPKLDVGKNAPQTIYAPASARVEDKRATELKQKDARRNIITILMLDPALTQQVRAEIQLELNQGNNLRQLAGAFPFMAIADLSLVTQVYLRKASEDDWQRILNQVDPTSSLATLKPEFAPQVKPSSKPTAVSPEQRRAIAELLACRRTFKVSEYVELLQMIAQVRLQYADALGSLPQSEPTTQATDAKNLIYDPAFLDLPDVDWQRAQPRINQIAEIILTQGIPPGLPQEVLENTIKLQLKGTVTPAAELFATRLLLQTLRPNLVSDVERTRLSAEQAAQNVEPEFVAVRQGDVIVRGGQEITSPQFALLDHFNLSRRGINWTGLIAFGVVVSGAVGMYCWLERRFHSGVRRRDRLMIWLLCLSAPLLIVLRVPSTNLPAVGLLVGSFYGSPLGVTVAGLLSVLLAGGMEIPWSQLLSSSAAGLVCGWMAGRLRSREELALLGTGVGVLQGCLYLVFNVASGMVWYTLLGSAGIHALMGLAWCIVAIGISPYLEQVFDLVSTIRLVELANPNRPLLKQLAAKTPGTFQHTLFVATLAEAAARALGCNVELVRTGTLYHDIGKMHDPQGFIENQMGGPNKHDLINDAWKSAEIIKKHVSEGLVMARKYRLPKAVQAFIPEHQGTMLIGYFYHHAQEWAKRHPNPDGTLPEIREADFRYDGPIPQSRETGIVMLADSCEAALRSLKDATYEEAIGMINKILRARWQDQQLVGSGLTREDMGKIATIFVEVWQQFNHQRIAYPKLAPTISPPRPEGASPTAIRHGK